MTDVTNILDDLAKTVSETHLTFAVSNIITDCETGTDAIVKIKPISRFSVIRFELFVDHLSNHYTIAAFESQPDSDPVIVIHVN